MNNRWKSYLMYRQKQNLEAFLSEYYTGKVGSRILFLLGKGFDPRMNNILRLFLENTPGQKLDCIAFDFPNGEASEKTKVLFDNNVCEFLKLKSKYNFLFSELKIDCELPWDKRIAHVCRKILTKDLSDYSDVVLDVSSLPRAFYFNIGKALFNKLSGDKSKNLFFAVSENVMIDEKIKKVPRSDAIEPLVGFRSVPNREANLGRINILVNLMGEQDTMVLERIYAHFQPMDMFPVLPFPSKDPRHSDNLMLKYHEFFKGKHFTEPQNITYADEQNPFELYRIVSNMIQGLQATFKPIADYVCFGIALLTSKLLSLGALLVGLEYNNCVTIYNVSSDNYEIEDTDELIDLNNDSEPFLLWITGEAYSES